MSSQKRARKHGRNRGQAIVEFALVIPVFLLILFGILDFGFMLYSRITLINATREGAHAVVTQVDNAQGIPVMVEASVRANSNTLVWSDVTVLTTCDRPGAGSCDFSGVAGTLAPGDLVNVATTYVYHSFFARFIGQSVTFGTNVSMVVE